MRAWTVLLLSLVGCAASAGPQDASAAGASGAGGIAGTAGTGAVGGTGGIGGVAGSAGTGGTSGSGGTVDAGDMHDAQTVNDASDPSDANTDTSTAQDSGDGHDAGGPMRCPGATPNPSEQAATTHKIKDLTGSGTSSAPFGVGGTDLGIAVRQPNGQIAYIFGDTFEQDGVGGPGWRAPVLLRSAPGLDGDGIEFNGAAGGQYAKQILDYTHENGRTYLPSDAITIGDRMYLHFIVNAGLGNVSYTQIAYSDDNGGSWTVSNARWEATENDSLQQLWTWERGCDGYVYVMSTKFISRDRAIILHRVPEDALLDKSQYEPWGYAGNQWAWGNPASVILEGDFGELCLRRVENKWVLAWFNAGDYDITIKVFDSPISNLYEARTLKPIRGGDWGAENNTTIAQLYGGYIHPDSTLANLHLIISQWNTSTNWPYRAMQWVTSVR